jgi:hypothetical protein
MKRFLALIAAVVILYSIYYDISTGTLPTASEPSGESHIRVPDKKSKPKSPFPYYEKKVTTGDTVLSIIEEQLDDSIPIPISQVVSDFEKLNNGTAPNEIQPGKTYKFPDYQKKDTFQ